MDVGPRLESACFAALRRSPKLQGGLLLLVVATFVVGIFRFELWTGKSSFDDAVAVCKENYIGAYMKWNNVDREEAEDDYESISGFGDAEIPSSFAFAVSMLCFVLWMFRTPHHSSNEVSMDKKCKFIIMIKGLGLEPNPEELK